MRRETGDRLDRVWMSVFGVLDSSDVAAAYAADGDVGSLAEFVGIAVDEARRQGADITRADESWLCDVIELTVVSCDKETT